MKRYGKTYYIALLFKASLFLAACQKEELYMEGTNGSADDDIMIEFAPLATRGISEPDTARTVFADTVMAGGKKIEIEVTSKPRKETAEGPNTRNKPWWTGGYDYDRGINDLYLFAYSSIDDRQIFSASFKCPGSPLYTGHNWKEFAYGDTMNLFVVAVGPGGHIKISPSPHEFAIDMNDPKGNTDIRIEHVRVPYWGIGSINFRKMCSRIAIAWRDEDGDGEVDHPTTDYLNENVRLRKMHVSEFYAHGKIIFDSDNDQWSWSPEVCDNKRDEGINMSPISHYVTSLMPQNVNLTIEIAITLDSGEEEIKTAEIPLSLKQGWDYYLSVG